MYKNWDCITNQYVKDKGILAIITFLLSATLLYSTFVYLGYFDFFPDSETLLQWDARWYNAIKNDGYYFDNANKSSVAFFPLFPVIWYVTGLDSLGISVINTLFFLFSFYFIRRHLFLSYQEALLFITLPGFYFYLVPYSEALFFAASTLLLIGLDRKRYTLVTAGLILASATRSISMLFAIALIFTFLIEYLQERQKKILFLLGSYLILVLLVTILVFYIHYLYTGEWGVFFRAQKMWNRELRWPVFPLTTISGVNMLWMDGLALLVCLLALVLCIRTFGAYLLNKKIEKISVSQLFSMACLALLGLISIGYSGVWQNGGGTSLISLNRFVFASPFLFFFLRYVLYTPLFKRKGYIIFLMSTALVWTALGAYKPLVGHTTYSQTLLYFCIMTILACLYLLINKVKEMHYFLALIQLVIGIYLYYLYQNEYWVG
ncbi:hypothetical protein J2T02_003958 [Chitinophaga terrae (ex Kim and Jung 2007)]|uniref:hypothetical protein n=1 Tax=Chitinophaga terrae (ex Kim and Jung 2007) TaxID=408074 RepID=UPI0027831754|nr:hypothetical protein [Chitinophaga terrae (ex Kim and Jung 2007)]MDQ0108818.1 hypothetical protein [Chitinophaga terrae (ex Kim and Jung 2007)]